MKHCVAILLLMLGNCILADRACAATLTVDLELSGPVDHSFELSFGGYFLREQVQVTFPSIPEDLSAFDELIIRATMPDGEFLLVAPNDDFSPSSMNFSWWWVRESGSLGPSTDYTPNITFLDAVGITPRQTNRNGFIRNRGEQLAVSGNYRFRGNSFLFSGIEVVLTGPFPGNGGPPLLNQSGGLTFSSNANVDVSVDPGPFVFVVPEPTTAALLLPGLALIAARNRH